MQLQFESGVTIESPTEADLSLIEGEEFAILLRNDSTYIQCAEQNEPPWEYILEYQNGSIREHYRALDGRITIQRVVVAFAKYLNNEDSWREDFQWERMELS